MDKLLIKTPITINGVTLSPSDVMNIANHYKRALWQEYIFENDENLSEEDALKVADEGIRLESKSCDSRQDELIAKAKENLGLTKADPEVRA